MTMLCINNSIVDPYFNLAAEEYLLKNFDSNFFMLWQNEPSVIIGKNQDVWSEIDTNFVEDKNIKVVRRYTGGGAVYHDLGNINITFSENGVNGEFRIYTKRIQDFLKSIGILSHVDERGGLTLNGLKISGSALCVHRNRTLFHATLLFSSNLVDVMAALNTNTNRQNLVKKYVQSKRSPVTNIKDHMEEPVTLEDFKKIIFDFFLNQNEENRSYDFNNEDKQIIGQLSKERYAVTDWTYNKK